MESGVLLSRPDEGRDSGWEGLQRSHSRRLAKRGRRVAQRNGPRGLTAAGHGLSCGRCLLRHSAGLSTGLLREKGTPFPADSVPPEAQPTRLWISSPKLFCVHTPMWACRRSL